MRDDNVGWRCYAFLFVLHIYLALQSKLRSTWAISHKLVTYKARESIGIHLMKGSIPSSKEVPVSLASEDAI